jgi:pimeloyl-ACP methyl ester carboxylesterase
MTESVTVNGTELAYRERGTGDPVVLVHGGVGDLREWELQVPALVDHFRMISLSCRGAWPNRPVAPDARITLDTFVEDLEAFLVALDAGPVHLVGHSSPGGFGGLLVASRHPERLRSLVLIEPPAFPLLGVDIPPRPLQLMRLLARRPKVALAFIEFGAKGVGPALKAFDRDEDERGLRVFLEAMGGNERVATIPPETFTRMVANVGPFKALLRTGFPAVEEADVERIRAPTLLVSGTDSLAPLIAVTDRLEALLPDVRRLDLVGAGHNMFMTHPSEFNAGVVEFLAHH